jgi:hypothetical protein
MARVSHQTITVSPPNLDRSGFLSLETGLGGRDGPVSRDWLVERMKDGFQLRMLREPRRGFIEFAPGRASWWPIEGADAAVVVQRLRVAPGEPGGSASLLLHEAEDWARFYGFSAVLALAGHGMDPAVETDLRARGFRVIDETADGVLLCMVVLQGPVALPRLPRNWKRRRAALGPGLVVQDTGHCPHQSGRAQTLLSLAEEAGLNARIDRLHSAEEARARLAAPGALFCVGYDGEVIDTGAGDVMDVWQEVRRRMRA